MTVEEFLNKTLHKQLLMYTHQGVETLFIKRIMQETGEPKETALRQFEDMLKTKKLPLPWIDTVNKRCGNLYVALGIGEIFGYDVQIPVLVVTRFDWARYHESNRAFKFRNLMNRILTSVYANENDFWEQLESNIWTTFQYDFEAHGTTEFYLDTVDPNGNYEIIPDDDAKQLYIRIFDQEETIDYDELRICTPEEVDDYGYITPEAFRKYLKQPIKPRDGKDITNLNPYAED